MTCENDVWTIKFPDIDGTDGPVEFRPHEMNFRYKQRKLDHFRGRFSSDVGIHLNNHTKIGEFSEFVDAEVCLNGETVRRMLFKPDGVQYGRQYTHIELFDKLTILDSGIVDEEYHGIKLKELYRDLLKNRPAHFYFNDIKFTIPKDLEDVELESPEVEGFSFGLTSTVTNDVTEGEFSLEFDNVSPLRAIGRVNKKYGLHTWVDEENNLWIGTPETNPTKHIVAPDDSRVWRYSDLNVRHPRRPIKAVLLRGAWIEQPGRNLAVDPGELWSWFSGQDGHTEDVRITGLAVREDIEDGLIFEQKSLNATRGGIEDAARLAYFEEVKNQYSGTVEINPSLSGDFTSFTDLDLGDSIHIVPDDKFFSEPYSENTGEIRDDPDKVGDWCGKVPNNEEYRVNGVRHEIDENGDWNITVEVFIIPENSLENVKTETVYFNPNADTKSEQYQSKKDISTHWLETID